VFRHRIFDGHRTGLSRLAAQRHYWNLLLMLRPNLVIVHAPELLPLTLLWQALGRGRKFLYDIRENYALNVSTQHVYQGLTRRGLAAGLRWVEAQAARRAAGVILAEASYAAELPFLSQVPAGRVVVLENKYQPQPGEMRQLHPIQLPPPSEPLRLLYSGTISELNGVWEAMALAEQLRAAWPGGVQLSIIGFCQQPGLLRQLEEQAADKADWLTLIGGAGLVPHARIVAEIGRSHLGLLPYRPHPSTERCRPTKMFEYLAHGLPVLASPNPLWQELLDAHGAGLSVGFGQAIDGPALVARLRGQTFYPNGIPADVQWAGEGKKLWHLLDSVI
jgi:glycogen synthase